jgi:large subunit ribosomal protein L4
MAEKATATKKEAKKKAPRRPKDKGLPITLYNQKGEVLKKIKLPEDIFGQKPNPVLLSQAARVYLAREKPKKASTKTRAEVAGGGRKPWRQKGTGRARAGSIRSPIWRGGGVVFGPKPIGKELTLPKKMRQKALAVALSGKYTEKAVTVVDKLEFRQPKTKKAQEVLEKLPIETVGTLLLILEDKDAKIVKSFRNIEKLEISRVLDLNVLSVLKFSGLIFTLPALEKLRERFGGNDKQGD